MALASCNPNRGLKSIDRNLSPQMAKTATAQVPATPATVIQNDAFISSWRLIVGRVCDVGQQVVHFIPTAADTGALVEASAPIDAETADRCPGPFRVEMRTDRKSQEYQAYLAERGGFEPPRRLPAYTRSRRAPSTTRPPLQTRSMYRPRRAFARRPRPKGRAALPRQRAGGAAVRAIAGEGDRAYL